MHKIGNFINKLILFSIFTSTPVWAQITPDNTLGASSSQLNKNTLGDRIEGGAIRGSNLFHSFSEFNVNDGQRVYFSNPSGITNILTRITGGNASSILGTLGVDGGANLFIMNPNGIFFGQNARLDVRGSFVGTTADSIKFADGNIFSAKPNQNTALLTISTPIGLQMGLQPGQIISKAVGRDLQGNPINGLGVNSGTIALIGGEITLDDSFIFANSGQIQLTALGSDAAIGFNVNGTNLNFTIPDNVGRAPVTLTNQALIFAAGNSTINIFGEDIKLNNSNVFGSNGGTIKINATGLNTSNSSIATITQGAQKAGDIQIQASDTVSIGNISQISSISSKLATGNGGDVTISAKNIAITGDGDASNSGNIYASTFGNASGGNLTLNATDSLNIDGGFVSIQNTGTGNAGNLTVRASDAVNVSNKGALLLGSLSSGTTGNMRIETGTLRVQNTNFGGGVYALSAGSGSVGSISIQARDVEVTNGSINVQVAPNTTGKAGDIAINAQRVNLIDGGQIYTGTSGNANAGNILIRADKSINIRGALLLSSLGITSFISSDIFRSNGNGGNITIETPRLTLSQGGNVSTSFLQSQGNAGNITIRAKDIEVDGFTFFPNEVLSTKFQSPVGGLSFYSSLSSEVIGANTDVQGGTITIDTERLRVSNGGELSASVLRGRGKGGNLVVRATDSIDIAGTGGILNNGLPKSSGLFAELQTEGIGLGGNINIQTGRLNMADGGQISTGTFYQGNAGDIDIRAAIVNLQGQDTKIATQVDSEATGNAGNLGITTNKLFATDGAEISSGTLGKGNAGNINIQANHIELQYTAVIISATNSPDNAGDIDINTQRLKISNGGAIAASAGLDSTGKGGNLTVNASESVEVTGTSDNGVSRSLLTVRSRGKGQAGNVTVNSPRIIVQDKGLINAESFAANGGNIYLNSDLIVLRKSGGISATAGNENAGGNGGNIDINSKFIVAFSNENSDISANAFEGNGGNINIKTQGLIGITPAAEPTPKSDITASSKLATQGQISITQPDVDPASGIIELPEQVVDATKQVAQVCPRNPGAKPLGEFKITGRGSLPPSPLEILPGTSNNLNLATLETPANVLNNSPKLAPLNTSNTIIEAQGWIKGADGNITLVATAPNIVNPKATSTTNTCPGAKIPRG